MSASQNQFSASIVVTTINDGNFLQEYYDNLKKFDRLSQAHFYVIADKKTPASLYDRAKALRQQGLSITIPTLGEQDEYLAKVGLDPKLILWNSDYRRNIGYLQAYASGTDLIISIDDDNYPLPDEDFLGGHASALFSQAKESEVESPNHFFNVCSLLSFDIEAPAPYPRGYPYYARHQEKNQPPAFTENKKEILVNAGLWLLDPDVDAISWLVLPRRGKSFNGKSVVLGRSTWSPVNSQNTALRRELLPAYYFIKMRYPLGGLDIDRYGDIFQGYFIQAVAKHLNGNIRFGTPLANHRRNSHNYMNDAWGEWACIQALEDLLPWLTTVTLSGSSAIEAYDSLSHALEDQVESMSGKFWTDAVKAYFHQMGFYMRKWNQTCRGLG